MRDTDALLLCCPVCDSEPDIWMPAEVGPGVEQHVSVVDALVHGYRATGRPYYRCGCGYEELVDPDAPSVE